VVKILNLAAQMQTMNKLLSLLSFILVVQVSFAQRLEPGLDKKIRKIFKEYNAAQEDYVASVKAANTEEDSKAKKGKKDEEPLTSPTLPFGEGEALINKYPQDWRAYYWAANFKLAAVYSLDDTASIRKDILLEVVTLCDRAAMFKKIDAKNYFLRALAYTELSTILTGVAKGKAIDKARFFGSEGEKLEAGLPEYYLWMGRKIVAKGNLTEEQKQEVLNYYESANLLLQDQTVRVDASPIFGFGVPIQCVNKLYPPLDEKGNPIEGGQATQLEVFERLKQGQGTAKLEEGQTRGERKMARDLDRQKNSPQDLSIKKTDGDEEGEEIADESDGKKKKKKSKGGVSSGGGSDSERSSSFGSAAGKPRRM